MCGIGGLIQPGREAAPDEALLASFRRALAHRGPDDHGTLREPGIGLVHTRLSILDLSRRARQPMESPSGRYVVSYNGEIYNFRELRRELSARGAVFRTASDTEVIVQLAELDGPAALARLEGMFAFALYDRQEHRILLMRDRLGIKPLFWAQLPDGVAFASEPKALRSLLPATRPDAARIAEYLTFRNLAGAETLLPGCHTLAPGSRLATDGRAVTVEGWHAFASPGARPEDEELAAVIEGAVERQRVSDAPVGVFLSGGVDSGLVAGALRDAAGPFESFSVGFDEKDWDETDRARTVASALGLATHVIRLEEEEYVRGLPRATFHLDAPLNHAHSVHLLALARFAREHIKVALTGEGGDELFAGYPRYRIFLAARALRRLGVGRFLDGTSRPAGRWSRVDRLIAAAGADEAEAAALNAAFADPALSARLAGSVHGEVGIERRSEVYRRARRGGARPLGALLALERETYLVSLLQRMDRMTMAAGLEARVPLLDEAVVGRALALPPDALADPWRTKKPLRRLAAARYGRGFAHAPKSGFGVPVGEWLRRGGPFSALADRLLLDRIFRERGWVDADAAVRLLREHRAGDRDHAEILWSLLALELFARVCADGEAPDELAPVAQKGAP